MKKYMRSQTKVASRVVRGPGSMFGKSEALQAAHAGRFSDAVKLAREHNRQSATLHREFDIPAYVISAWANTPDDMVTQ